MSNVGGDGATCMCEETGFLIRQISNQIRKGADEHLREIGLTFSQSKVMGYIYYNGGTVTQRDIENFMQVSHPTVVGLVSRMEKNKLVTCKKDQQDKRNKIVTETEKARKLIKDFEDGRIELEKRMVQGFSEDEKTQLHRLLHKLMENMGRT